VRVAVVGLAKKIVERELSKHGLKLDRRSPQIVISFGGDGTALYAEKMYPGVPRIMIKHSSKCKKCNQHNFSKVLTALKNKKYKIVEEIKVEGSVNGKKLIGLNEVNIHNRPCTKAIRFSVAINNKTIAKEVIGDGLIVATPYGSGAYFYSIAGKTFKRGLGVAFNNPHKKLRSKVVNDKSKIKLRILRGKGLLCVDNNEKMIPLKTGDVVKIRKAVSKARIIELGKRRKISNY